MSTHAYRAAFILTAVSLATAAMVACTPSNAPEPDAAHVHGRGDVLIDVQGNEVTVQVYAPAANFGLSDGVETGAGNASDLGDIDRLVSFPEAAGCRKTRSETSRTHHDGTHEDHDHDHEHEHEHDEGDQSADTDENMDVAEDAVSTTQSADGHFDIDIELRLTCDTPAALDAVTLPLFDVWPGFESVNLTLQTADGAEAVSVRDSATRTQFP